MPYLIFLSLLLSSSFLLAQLQPLPEAGGELLLQGDSIFYIAPKASYLYQAGQFIPLDKAPKAPQKKPALAWGAQERYILDQSQNFRAGYWAKDLDQSEALLEQKKAESWQSFRLFLPPYEDAYIYSLIEKEEQLYLCLYLDEQHFLQLIAVEPQPPSLK
ncbi:hypothetical protein SapgrDRAFT_0764 [Saprospira grandis DSM 2844]|uniref:Uncharacterized protein n=1 Tax=Saprospira grandis DSM 2844 TaxID=694433 RepID=J1I1E1_9BACT|nr:hypothetical protein [Saprospira grandis]EJF52505.1 hypothetical protein SapgrDRAFT_0764 [Saprospira grandis DSM 2844]